MNLQQLYINLLNNPFALKNYRNLVDYYQTANQQDIADAFRYLISNKFNEDNISRDNEEQPTNNQ